jgi:asparagine synthase (glutamine-hydrolysing)
MIMRAPFLAYPVVRALYQMPASVRESNQCATVVIGRRPEMMAIATDMGLLGTSPLLVQAARRWSRKVSFKAEYWTSHGAPDWVAGLGGSASLGRIERQFLGWHKFQHFRLWLRNELSGFARETIAQSRQGTLSDWFDLRRIDAMVDDHVAGRRNYTDEIDKLLTVALVGRTLLQEGYLAPKAAAPARHIRMSAA